MIQLTPGSMLGEEAVMPAPAGFDVDMKCMTGFENVWVEVSD